uniref:histidine kinase n=1 Tax=uncultured bacterium UPO50 TaxID=1776975 RepID=A0A126SYB3_9BACT|nr:periplasmic sensor signal transduction histidine kinase (Tn6048) [uncultured bacterium UPO50]
MKNSLQLKLSLWLSVAILMIALIAGGFSFFSAFDEANELQDDVLLQVAVLFDRHRLTLPQANDSGREVNGDAESHVFVQLFSTPTSSVPIRDADQALALPPNLGNGMQTASVGNTTYRVLVKTLSTGQRLAVAQETAFRDEIARDGALRTLMPFLILIPVLLLVVATLIRKIFKPVANLAGEIDQRGEQALHPIVPGPLPAEIQPFVGAINRLLARIAQSMDTQRRFVADAAHELRSPLTALSLQAERLADAEMSATAHERLHMLRQGVARGRALLDQLLMLAQAQASTVLPGTPVSVQQIFRRVLEDLMPLAEVKRIDIGVASDSDAQVFASEIDLISLIKNLVDNAIRYTPVGGRVDLSVLASNGVATLVVEDNGPGIPESERTRVFDPFYRILGSDAMGSGLGLSIVQIIAARVGAKISLGFANDASRSGLRVVVTFPLAAIEASI